MDKPNRPPRKKKMEQVRIPQHTGEDYFMQETVNHFLEEFSSLFGTIDRLEHRMEQNKYSDRQVSSIYLASRLDVHDSARGGSYEEELEERLQKMIRVSSMLKYMCKREQHHRMELVKAVKLCFERCTLLLEEMTVSFQQKYTQSQDTINANAVKLNVYHQQLERTRAAYETLLNQASQSVDVLEHELKQELRRNKELKQKVSELEQTVQTLTIQNEALSQKGGNQVQDTDENENDRISYRDLLNMSTDEAVSCLKQEASDKAWKHIETLLEIAVSRLKMHEQDGGTLQYTAMTSSMCSDSASCATSLNSTCDHHSMYSAVSRSNTSLDAPLAPPRRHRGRFSASPLRKTVSSEGILENGDYGSSTECIASRTSHHKLQRGTKPRKEHSSEQDLYRLALDTKQASRAAPKAPKRRKSFASRTVSMPSQESKENREAKEKLLGAFRKDHGSKKDAGTKHSDCLDVQNRATHDGDNHGSNYAGRDNSQDQSGIEEKEREIRGKERSGNSNSEPRRRKKLAHKRRAQTMVNFFKEYMAFE